MRLINELININQLLFNGVYFNIILYEKALQLQLIKQSRPTIKQLIE